MHSPPNISDAATIIAQDAVDKLAALETIARAVGSTVSDAGTSHPTVPLADGVWVQIDIPKFGEPPPLAIDVHATAGREVALRFAIDLLDTLRGATDWSLATDFNRVH